VSAVVVNNIVPHYSNYGIGMLLFHLFQSTKTAGACMRQACLCVDHATLRSYETWALEEMLTASRTFWQETCANACAVNWMRSVDAVSLGRDS
jgi:hypothetical protein